MSPTVELVIWSLIILVILAFIIVVWDLFLYKGENDGD